MQTVTYDPTQWQLVPKRTNVRMAEEGWQAAVDRAVLNIDNWDATIMYEAMLAAAPEYPSEQQEAIGEVIESSVHPDAFGIYKHTFYSEERIPVGAELFVRPVEVVSEPLTDELPVSPLQQNVTDAVWSNTRCFVTSPETEELPPLIIQTMCGNKEVNRAVARRVAAVLNYCKGLNTAELERAIERRVREGK